MRKGGAEEVQADNPSENAGDLRGAMIVEWPEGGGEDMEGDGKQITLRITSN